MSVRILAREIRAFRGKMSGLAKRRSTRMPFAVEQFTLATAAAVIWIPWGVLFFLYAGYRVLPHMLAALFVGFWIPAVGYAFLPINPYNFWMDRPNPWRRPSIRELDEPQRRLLTAYYDPANRRRAVKYVLIASLLFAALWAAATLFERKPSPVWRLDYLLLTFLATATSTSAWLAYAGLGEGIRRNWRRTVTETPAWPIDRRYPGPWKDRVVSFWTNRLPEFLVSRHPEGP